MYFDFDFNKDAQFFKNSSTFKLVIQKVKESKYASEVDNKILETAILLWAECVIKNNLDINAHRVEAIHLISEQNSKKVFDTFGKAVWKDKDKRKEKDWEIIRTQSMVNNLLQIQLIYLHEEGNDVFSELKKEFKVYKLAKNLDESLSEKEKTSKTKKI